MRWRHSAIVVGLRHLLAFANQKPLGPLLPAV